MPFQHIEIVRFGMVDAAGIVFFPRLHEMLSNTVEAWFTQALGHPWPKLHLEQNLGTPIVHSEVTYRAASRLGDHLTFTLTVAKLGRSSFDLKIIATCAHETRLEAQQRHTFVQLHPLKSAPIPDHIRTKMLLHNPHPPDPNDINTHDHPTFRSAAY